MPLPAPVGLTLRALRESWPRTPLTDLLNIRLPVIQAPMSPITTAALVAAVSNAGGLGSIAAARMSPQQLQAEIREVQRLTRLPFAVNLFVPKRTDPYFEHDTQRSRHVLLHRVQRGMYGDDASAPPLPSPPPQWTAAAFDASVAAFEQQAETLLQAGAPVFSWTFGIPSVAILQDCRRRGVRTVGTATTPLEGWTLAETGLVDAIVAQGSEAGGHRGSFLGNDLHTASRSSIGLFSLLQLLSRVVPPSIPIIAAGGVMDGRGLLSALLLGASGAQLGTRFMTATESTTLPDAHRQLLLRPGRPQDIGDGAEGEAEQEKRWRRRHLAESYSTTVLTRVFSGRAARGFRNNMVAAFDNEQGEEAGGAVLPWQVQASQVQPYAKAAAERGDARWMQLWAGQSYPLCSEQPAAEIVAQIMHEAQHAMQE
jgi:nitronate monooxygenase